MVLKQTLSIPLPCKVYVNLYHWFFFFSVFFPFGCISCMIEFNLFVCFFTTLTVCNRTWFGDIGKTYEMEIYKPNALPFICYLNFTAPGGLHGDIIQVSKICYKVIRTQFNSKSSRCYYIQFFFGLTLH